VAERQAQGSRTAYGSIMCSIAGGVEAGDGPPSSAAALDRLGAAIEELAAAAQCRSGGAPDFAERLARLWEMVADLDPELARRLPGYGS
jgi:hypothetical protein